MNDTSLLLEVLAELKEIKEAFIQLPEWFPLSELSKDKGLTRQTIRAQLLNGSFEPEVDFKYIGNKIYVARSAVSRITRKRR